MQIQITRFFIAVLLISVASTSMASEPVKIAFKSGREPCVLPKKPFKNGGYDASKFLGPAYKSAIETAKSYQEIDDQEKQVPIFLAGRTAVVVMDVNIFKYGNQVYGKPENKHGLSSLLGDRFFFSIGFTDSKLAGQFEKGVNTIKANGVYVTIYKKILDQPWDLEKTKINQKLFWRI